MGGVLHIVGTFASKLRYLRPTSPNQTAKLTKTRRRELVMTLPIAMIRKMRMRSKEKFVLAVVFGIVVIDICFVVLRMYFDINLQANQATSLWYNLDPIVAVLVCALPCYRSLLSPSRTQPIVRVEVSSIPSPWLSGSRGGVMECELGTETASTTHLPNNRVENC